MANSEVFMGKFFIFVVASLLFFSFASSLDLERENRLKFGHTLYITNITTDPENIVPGAPSLFKVSLLNTGEDFIRDIRLKVTLPEKIASYNDIAEKKISEMQPGESGNLYMNIIALPNAEEGVYKIPISIRYVNYIGDEREENVTTSIIVRTKPQLFVELKSTDIYKGNEIGNIVIKVVNNDLDNIKFLTVGLGGSSDYDLLGYQKEYVGDLDSDDFQEVEFKLKVHTDAEGKTPDNIKLPIEISYADSFNKEYSENLELNLKMRTKEELGIKTDYTWAIVICAVLIMWVIYAIYRHYRKKRLKHMGKQASILLH